MTRFGLLKKLDVSLASNLIFNLRTMFDSPEQLREHMSSEITEEELRQINDAALGEGHQPLFFSGRQ